MKSGYYSEKLCSERLRRCYEIASPRVRRYLNAEIEFVREHVRQGDALLELGCGYGRVLLDLAADASLALLAGIDTSLDNLDLARKLTCGDDRFHLLAMDATRLGFRAGSFDVVICVQNGLCAFGVDPVLLLREAMRVSRPGATVLFSSYSDRFWSERLRWFEAQAAEGLVGAIDHSRTGDGRIVCRDGFQAGALTGKDFLEIGKMAGTVPGIVDVDGSSLFGVWRVPGFSE